MKPVVYAEAHAAPKEPLSFEAFLQQYDDAHAEWVNGEVVPKMPASVEHQDTSMFLLSLIVNWVAYHELGKVYHPPLLVKLPLPDNREVAREPDIVVILNGNLRTLRGAILRRRARPDCGDCQSRQPPHRPLR
jgi:Uma2 family endonuclease